MTSKTLLVVYHTMTGGSRQMAEAVVRGARQEDSVDVRLLRARDAQVEDVLAADGYVFVTPENLASMSGLMKDFFDRTYYGALDRLNGRPYAALVCAGSDGQGAARQLERIALGWRLEPIGSTLIVNVHAQTPEAILSPKHIGAESLQTCEEIGHALAAGLQLGIY
jgi:multimeric flavodoxin WrbA